MRNNFRDAVERAEDGGASAEELRTLLGRGRAKKGIFEGDLEEGELEIGQVSAIVSRQQSVAEVMNECAARPSAFNALPALNPNHPNQRKEAPRTTDGIL